MNALELMHAQVRTLYELDFQGRLRRIPDLTAPESEWEAAPRFFLGLTLLGNVWHARHDLPGALLHELDVLCRRSPLDLDALRAALGGGEEWRGPAYLIPAQENTGQAIQITAENADLLLPDFPSTAQRARAGKTGPVTAVIQGGQAVAVCSCVRQSHRSSQPGAAEAGVHTLEASRGKGYAVMVTALWANLVRESGLLPLYSTGWDNLASQGVARKLNAQMFGEDWSIR